MYVQISTSSILGTYTTDGFGFSCVVVAVYDNVIIWSSNASPKFLTTSIASIRDAMFVVRNLGR